MPTIDLPQTRLEYRVAGPADSPHPPVVFVHGLLVDAELWAGVATRLAERGVRSYALDLPLGAHRVPTSAPRRCTPRGVAAMVVDAIAALELRDVTLVGNDTGGAVCQFAIDADPGRIGRLVLTNCDAFEKFPPPPFGALNLVGRRPPRLQVMLRALRWTWLRQSRLGYGGLARTRLDPALTARWARAGAADPGIARDAANFLATTDKRELLEVATRFGDFDRPVLLVWGARDPFFRLELARRLAAAFASARLVEVPGARTFVPLDEPDVLADSIVEFSSARA